MFVEGFELEMHDAKAIKRIWIIDWIGAIYDILATIFSLINSAITKNLTVRTVAYDRT